MEHTKREELVNVNYKLAINSDGFYIVDKQVLAAMGLSTENIEEYKLNKDQGVENIIFVPIVYHEEKNAIVFSVEVEHDDKILTSLNIEPAEREDNINYEVERVQKIDYVPEGEVIECDEPQKVINELSKDSIRKISRITPRAQAEKRGSSKKAGVEGKATNAGGHRRTDGGSKANRIKALPTTKGQSTAAMKGQRGGSKGGYKHGKSLKESIRRMFLGEDVNISELIDTEEE